MTEDRTDGVFRLLFVCTANQCRSPMAAALAEQFLRSRDDVDAAVASCGCMPGGVRASAGSVRAMLRVGLDISTHLSSQMDLDTVLAADLVLTMERRHLPSVAELSVESVQRAFTLAEFAELAGAVGPRRPDVSTAEWIASAAAIRDPASVLAVGTEFDIDDPMGGPNRAYRRTAERIEALLDRSLTALFPPVDTPQASTPGVLGDS